MERTGSTRARDVFLAGLLTGLLTGLFWSSVVELFSTDQEFDGTELLLSLSVPVLVSLLIWKVQGARLWVQLLVAHLTLLIPLFGIGIGGANVLQMTLGGTIGGAFWVSPFVLWRFIRSRRESPDAQLQHPSGSPDPDLPDP